ncbi:hypothetical protein ABTW96_07470 [Nocardia beijingensis]
MADEFCCSATEWPHVHGCGRHPLDQRRAVFEDAADHVLRVSAELNRRLA